MCLLNLKKGKFYMPSNKKIRVFAGPNGSGKSTLFNEFSKNYNTGFFINADLLEKKLSETGLIDLQEIGLVGQWKYFGDA